MCLKEIDTKYSCGHLATKSAGTSWCLYGNLCEKVKHVHVITKKVDEVCDFCTEAGKHANKGYTLQDRTPPKKRKYPDHHVLLKTIKGEALNLKMAEQLKIHLQKDLPQQACKDLLYAILYQPRRYTNYSKLLHIFGQGVSGYFSDDWEKEMHAIAQDKGHENAVKKGIFADAKERNARRAAIQAAKDAAEQRRLAIEDEKRIKKEAAEAKKKEEAERKYIVIK